MLVRGTNLDNTSNAIRPKMSRRQARMLENEQGIHLAIHTSSDVDNTLPAPGSSFVSPAAMRPAAEHLSRLGQTVQAARPASIAKSRRRVAGGIGVLGASAAAVAVIGALAPSGAIAAAGPQADLASGLDQAAPQAVQTTTDVAPDITLTAATTNNSFADPALTAPSDGAVHGTTLVTEVDMASLSTKAAKPAAPAAPAPRVAATTHAATNSGADDYKGSNIGATVFQTAMNQIGRGIYGSGSEPSGWDCSGFVQWVFRQHGVSVPRTVGAQAAAATRVSNPQAGDLVVFYGGSHIGFYDGNGGVIDSPDWGRHIEHRKIWTSSVAYYRM